MVAETAETLLSRAKNADALYGAIQAKLTNQAVYAVWRQDVAQHGGDRKSKLQNGKLDLPAADPGDMVIHRWRKRLCRLVQKRWEIDPQKLGVALAEAKLRCVRICEQENLGTIRGTEGTGEFERYTPGRYIEAARTVMGGLDWADVQHLPPGRAYR